MTDTPTLILTGHDDEETAVTAAPNGAQDYLFKGEIGGNALVRAARYAMERKREVERIRKALRATIQAIAVTVETRDPYTYVSRLKVAMRGRPLATRPSSGPRRRRDRGTDPRDPR